MTEMRETKKPHKMFRYSADTVEQELLKIAEDTERDYVEQMRLMNMRKFIMTYEAGYRRALVDYGIVTQQEADNG